MKIHLFSFTYKSCCFVGSVVFSHSFFSETFQFIYDETEAKENFVQWILWPQDHE